MPTTERQQVRARMMVEIGQQPPHGSSFAGAQPVKRRERIVFMKQVGEGVVPLGEPFEFGVWRGRIVGVADEEKGARGLPFADVEEKLEIVRGERGGRQLAAEREPCEQRPAVGRGQRREPLDSPGGEVVRGRIQVDQREAKEREPESDRRETARH